MLKEVFQVQHLNKLPESKWEAIKTWINEGKEA
jgi:hypothetical protein